MALNVDQLPPPIDQLTRAEIEARVFAILAEIGDVGDSPWRIGMNPRVITAAQNSPVATTTYTTEARYLRNFDPEFVLTILQLWLKHEAEAARFRQTLEDMLALVTDGRVRTHDQWQIALSSLLRPALGLQAMLLGDEDPAPTTKPTTRRVRRVE